MTDTPELEALRSVLERGGSTLEGCRNGALPNRKAWWELLGRHWCGADEVIRRVFSCMTVGLGRTAPVSPEAAGLLPAP